MTLGQLWREVPSGNEFTLLDKIGNELLKVIKRGSYANTIRMLSEITSEENILCDRWRWRIR